MIAKRFFCNWTIITAAGLVFATGPLAAQSASSEYYGYSPAEARLINQRISAYKIENSQPNSTITNLARLKRIAENSLWAIARKLGLEKSEMSLSNMLRVMEQKADEAKSIQDFIVRLQLQVERMSDANLRTPAAISLKRAEAAFALGDFELAEKELSRLSLLRASDSEEAATAWLQAILTEASLAEIQGKYEVADQFLLDADGAVRERSDRQRWKIGLQRQTVWRRGGQTESNAEYFGKAIEIGELSVMPLAKSELEQEISKRGIGLDYAYRGNITGDMSDLRRASKDCGEILDCGSSLQSDEELANANYCVGLAKMSLAYHYNDASAASGAENRLDESLSYFESEGSPIEIFKSKALVGNNLIYSGTLRVHD